jgi:hypothetical protein
MSMATITPMKATKPAHIQPLPIVSIMESCSPGHSLPGARLSLPAGYRK